MGDREANGEREPLINRYRQRTIPVCEGFYHIFFKGFYILCTLTGQLPIKATGRERNRKCAVMGTILTTMLTIVFTLVNISALLFDLYVITWCPYKNCGYINVVEETKLVNLTGTENVSNSTGLKVVQPINLTIFDDWQKTVITTATASGTISYLFMIYVLYSQYSDFKIYACGKIKECLKAMWNLCGENNEDKPEGILLSPFNDDIRLQKATKLSPKKASYFMTILFFNMLVYCANVALLFAIFARSVDKKQKVYEVVDAIGLSFQFVSQLCAILSCFIFSKLAYSVGTMCVIELPKLYNKVDRAQKGGNDQAQDRHRGENGNNDHAQDRPGEENETNDQAQGRLRGENENDIPFVNNDEQIQSLLNGGYITQQDVEKKSRLHLLKAIANWYSRMIHTTLHPFGTWFAVHWVLYTITAFMSISYLAETIILELYGQDSADRKCHGEHNMPCQLKLSYIFFFALDHCILFLYPCFRAASVTTAYASMMKKVSSAEWTTITLDDKEKFINYLKIKDCTFKISILCAKLSFGFYVAYFSIFVGIFGVVLKLAL